MARRVIGTVRLLEAKDLGYIAWEDGPDILVCLNDITTQGVRTLQEGDKVVFDIEQGPNGLQVSNLCADLPGDPTTDAPSRKK